MRALSKFLRSGIHVPLLLSLLLPFVSQAATEEGQGDRAVKRVLLYDYSIRNIFDGPKTTLREALTKMAKEQDFTLTMTRDAKAIRYQNLKTFDVVIFAYGNGDVVPSKQGQADFERYVREGGGFVALHAAAGPIRDFAFLAEAVAVQYTPTQGGSAKARLYADPQALANPDLQRVFKDIPREIVLKERWFNFKSNPREKREVTVLFSVDESTYPQGRMNGDHPMVWTQTIGKGRVVYNGLGHENIYSQEDGYGSRLLWNLMEYVANKNTDEGLSKGVSSINAPVGVTLDGRNLAMTLGEGSYALTVSDFQGRTVLSKTFVGPGLFHTDPIATNGNYTLTLTGPSTRIRKQFSLK